MDEPAETNLENLSEKIHCVDNCRTDTAFRLSDSLQQINSQDKCILRPLEKKDTVHENEAEPGLRHRPKLFEFGIDSK